MQALQAHATLIPAASLGPRLPLRATAVRGIHGRSAASVRPARQITTVPCQLRRVRAQAIPSEIAQLAGEGGFIAGVASVMFGITLLGLAVGFVILRFEALTEEGKI
ncbi:Cytochrome b6-f complex subunit 7, chloroplastic [Auxenochlorella protothecoides]|uniref:Cytochrome b6-f complex subunit 7, chloroplastic n=2 Tax=Auxenochlorella protothecoides TaxID=3075 RepID=A0A087STG6_AUXPR|nr:Cytochrome b6-f complex subunit 7, chloroplastic [Auxenochlorella protothecoides]KFM29020.1 Cytochrome b6-f complex subunit 7, chloroplastic [Auxenochlorella protothecoides]